jgi:long-subunit fatty acid transport protein
MRTLPSFAMTILLAVIALPAVADTDIDVVYGDDIARRGELAAELAARWSQTSRARDFAGRMLWQAVGELAYGVSDNVSVGVKLPVSRVDGSWHGHGAYAEVKYLASRGAMGFYWGAEIEAGSINAAGEERTFVLEAFPILGYRIGRFHLTGNPGLDYTSEGEDKGWGFSPKAKVSYRLSDAHAFGLEYHVDAGKFGDFAPRSKRSETAYLTWDGKVAGQQMSVALGHGTTHASDRWAVRIGIELDD